MFNLSALLQQKLQCTVTSRFDYNTGPDQLHCLQEAVGKRAVRELYDTSGHRVTGYYFGLEKSLFVFFF